MHPIRRSSVALALTIAAAICCYVALAGASALAAGVNLAGEEFTAASAALTPHATGGDPYCGATQQGSVDYSVSGSASGPYPGTFSETGQWDFDLITEQTFHAQFTIVSGASTIRGHIAYDQTATGPEGRTLIANYGSCTGSQSGGAYSVCANEAFAGSCAGQSIAQIDSEGFSQVFVGTPRVTTFTPTSAITGSTVTLTGSGFSGASQVRFGTRSAIFSVVSSSQIQAIVPNGTKAGKIVVSTPFGSAASALGFSPTLSVLAVSPASGRPGRLVAVKGVGFAPSTSVSFAGTRAASVTFVSSGELRVAVPAFAASGPVSVTNSLAPAGTVSSSSSFTVL
jgi:hypothetical protein